MHHPTDRIAHTTAFVTPVVVHWLEREIAQWVHPMKDRSDDPSHHGRTLLPRSYISLLVRSSSRSSRFNVSIRNSSSVISSSNDNSSITITRMTITRNVHVWTYGQRGNQMRPLNGLLISSKRKACLWSCGGRA